MQRQHVLQHLAFVGAEIYGYRVIGQRVLDIVADGRSGEAEQRAQAFDDGTAPRLRSTTLDSSLSRSGAAMVSNPWVLRVRRRDRRFPTGGARGSRRPPWLRLPRRFRDHSQEVQEAVNDHVTEVMGQRLALLPAPRAPRSRRRWRCRRAGAWSIEVAGTGKGQDVGRLVHCSEPRVEAPDFRIVAKQQVDLGALVRTLVGFGKRGGKAAFDQRIEISDRPPFVTFHEGFHRQVMTTRPWRRVRRTGLAFRHS